MQIAVLEVLVCNKIPQLMNQDNQCADSEPSLRIFPWDKLVRRASKMRVLKRLLHVAHLGCVDVMLLPHLHEFAGIKFEYRATHKLGLSAKRCFLA